MEDIKAYTRLAEIYDEYWGKFSLDYLPFLQGIFTRHGQHPKTILDSACGTGVLVAKLAETADRVVGLDSSAEMLEIARRNCAHCPNVEFIEGDIRSFNLHKRFDLILCCFDSINYVDEPGQVRSVLCCVRQHLEESGLFSFDFVNERHFLVQHGSSGRFQLKGIPYDFACSYNSKSRVAEITFTFDSGIERHRQVPIEYDEMAQAIDECGLHIDEVFADLHGGPVKESTKRFFMVVRS